MRYDLEPRLVNRSECYTSKVRFYKGTGKHITVIDNIRDENNMSEKHSMMQNKTSEFHIYLIKSNIGL